MEVEADVVVPMEESLEALLDYFVEPYLSHEDRKTRTAIPSISQQQLIAKQVHAVVLLYNYYLRKRHQSLEYLDFESFCKLAVVLKPNLMLYMKLMRQAEYSEVDLENNPSETEKSIRDACHISLALDASKQVPNCESWPISKVAVLLTDASKEKCLLFLGTVTAGAWSVLEKNVDVRDMGSNDIIGGHIVYRRKKFTKNKANNDQHAHEVGLQKVVLSAIEETAGINQANLIVLEKHNVYSLSKEKTAAGFYIVQCTQPSRGDIQISIKEVVDSLQGSLVKKKSSGWVMSSAVEYFHMLPYVGIMMDWLSRKGLEDLKAGSGIDPQNDSPVEDSCKTEFSDKKGISSEAFVANASISKTSTPTEESFQRKDLNGCQVNRPSNKVDESCSMEIDDLHISYSRNKRSGRSSSSSAKFEDQNPNIAALHSHEHAFQTVIVKEPDRIDSNSLIPGLKDDTRDSGKQSSMGLSTPSKNNELLPVGLDPKYEDLRIVLASRDEVLTQTAMRVLLHTREKLTHRLHTIEDEIALCDKAIQSILQGSENRSGKDAHTQLPEQSNAHLVS